MPDRHPLGRTCRDPLVLLTVLLLMPYALIRHGVSTLRPTRTPDDDEIDLPPCGNTWGPLDCPRVPSWRGHGTHTCWTWTGWPHVCRCLRCDGREADRG